MPENSVCPDRGHLHQLLTSTLTPQELEPISAHVETCERCQKTLESLLSENSFLPGLADGGGPVPQW